jgi:carbonic anhydrase
MNPNPPQKMESYRRLLLNNKAWVEEKLNLRPDFFSRHSLSQSPEFLWIGCSDSRVPAEEITGVEPGDLFVHRNIANLVIHTDFNMLSVVQYAVEVLKVRHIIVCGHYGCGGVKTALSRQHLGLINKWLRHIKDVYRLHSAELDAIPDEQKRNERLIELNVSEQVHHLAELSFVQRAWKVHGRPMLHGWIYDIHSGHIKQVKKVDPGQLPHDIYVYEFPDLEGGVS